MSRYLVVAHQTATSSSLTSCVRNVLKEDPGAQFTLLVPATPVEHLVGFETGDARAVARQMARRGKEMLEASGATVWRTVVGDASPLLAIDDELRDHPGEYHSVIIATLPPDISRWLRVDLPERVEDKFGLSVIHVTAKPGEHFAETSVGGSSSPGDASTVEFVVRHLIQALAGGRPLPAREARSALVALGPVAIPYLVDAMHSGDREIRLGTFKVLARVATPEAAPALVEALQDADGGIRWLAAEGLAQAGLASLPSLLVALMRASTSAWLRDGAQHVLHRLRLRPDYPQGELAPLERSLRGVASPDSVMVAANEALIALRASHSA